MITRWKSSFALFLVLVLCVGSVGSTAALLADPSGIRVAYSEEEGCCGGAEEAPRWMVGGAFLGAGAGKGFVGTNSAPLRIGSAEAGFKLIALSGECQIIGEAVGSAAAKPGTATNVVFSCVGVTDENDPEEKCTIRSAGEPPGVVWSQTLVGTLVWTKAAAGAAGLRLSSGGANFLTFLVEGKECPLKINGAQVTGQAIGNISQEVELEELEASFPGAPTLDWWNNKVPREKEAQITPLATAAGFVVLDTVFRIRLAEKGQVFGVFPG